MTNSVAAQINRLREMTLNELRTEWENVFGEPTKQRHRVYLWKRLARKLQEEQLPKLTAEEETTVAGYRKQIRQMPPEQWFLGKQRGRGEKARRPARDRRIPPPGSAVRREFKGQEVVVKICDEGFEYDGVVYRSLSAAVREVTGYSSVNGLAFFGLRKGDRK